MSDVRTGNGVRRDPPAIGAQLFAVFRTQLRRYVGSPLILMAVAILALPFMWVFSPGTIIEISQTFGISFYDIMMSALPVTVLLCMFLFSGGVLHPELREGLGRLSMAQPVPRWVHFHGKLLAASVASVAAVAAACCVIAVSAGDAYGVPPMFPPWESFALCAASAVALNAATMCFGVLFKMPAVKMFSILTMVSFAVFMTALYTTDGTMTGLQPFLDSVSPFMQCMLPTPLDTAVHLAGSGIPLTVWGFTSYMMYRVGVVPPEGADSFPTGMAVCIVWIVASALLGQYLMNKVDIK